MIKQAKGIVLLVRNPYDAILAEFNRRKSHASHTASANQAVFNSSSWYKMIDTLSVHWRDLHVAYANFLLKHRNIPLHVIFYENLKESPLKEMTDLLEYLKINFGFSTPDTEDRLTCLAFLQRENAKFKRQKKPFGWEIYPIEKIKIIDRKLGL